LSHVIELSLSKGKPEYSSEQMRAFGDALDEVLQVIEKGVAL
jgi:hypothetical protein